MEPALKPAWHLEPTWRWAVILACVYAAGMSLASCLNEAAFTYSAYDFGVHIQAIWKLSKLQGFFNTIRGLNIWGDHVWLIMPLYALPYALLPSPYLLLAMQATIVASGAVAVFLLARSFKASPWCSLALSAAYLLYPSTTNMVLENFHPEIAACAFLLWAFACIERKRRAGYWIFIVLALSCKEDVSLGVALFGVYVFIRHGRLAGALTTALAIAWFAVAMKVILPAMNGTGFFRFSGGYWFAEFAARWHQPAYYWSILSAPGTWRYLLIVLGPLAFLPILAPLEFLPALAPVAINILSRNDYLTGGKCHYEFAAIPFLFLATAKVVAGIRRPRLARPAAAALLAALVLGASLNSTFRWSLFADRLQALRGMNVQMRQLAISRIPADPGITVSASHMMVTKLANRNGIYLFPNPWKINYWGMDGENQHRGVEPDYVVLDMADIGNMWDDVIGELEAGGKYGLAFGMGSAIVLKKRSK